ncbi:type II toxin-antitoxin system RelE/ParE family toxin [Geoalkalibacter halelectricus]|uniref:Type II toxin-antitoxin system RelE/ParE family toxin n=1 Tax=Geoalkalibacter halelectricus TaxID=2847045 RepID=A0ABY5ZST6_9BACT|nr:type II toxin-antitoxin system RelE/ParE family toxin [Geoalkalibacter halelectricus]MDO3378379.1 type II toxin-antitoxin system RelE/ParE family toxin [Geoalkalibacter halelectricus]UWZ80301.1 type II toxin-antitoxin system RelE/ParE family toxin [Geoalkalibacter halelectricus]
MLFIESSIFRRYLANYLTEDEFRGLQLFLAENPEAGAIVKGSGGLRKLRWRASGQGKRGGLRVIYYWQVREKQIYLLTLYAKNEVTDLSPEEVAALRKMVEVWNQ